MATTVYTYQLDGTQREFVIPFEYLARRFVTVTLLGAERLPLEMAADYKFATSQLIQTNSAYGPTGGYDRIEIKRTTSATDRLVSFADGSVLRAYELNISQIQTIHIAEESRDRADESIHGDGLGDYDASNRRIKNIAPALQDNDAVSYGQIKDVIESGSVAVSARDEVLRIAQEFGDVESAVAGAESARDEAISDGRDPALQAVADAQWQAGRAETAATVAEAASNSAFVNADVYPDVATGLAAVADGEQFQVVEGMELVRYRKVSTSVAEEVARFPSTARVREVSDKLPPLLRQADTVEAGLAVTASGERFMAYSGAGAGLYEVVGNLYNPAAAEQGSYIATTGEIGPSNPVLEWARSDYIPVKPGDVVAVSTNEPKRGGIAFYDSQRNPLGPPDNSTNNPLLRAAPEGAAFVVINVRSPTIPEPSEIMVTLGEVRDYLPFGQNYAEELLVLTGQTDLDQVTERVASRNLFDPEKVVPLMYIGSTSPHTLNSAAGWACVVIPVNPGETFTIYSDGGSPRRGGIGFYTSLTPQFWDEAIEGSYNSSPELTVTAPPGAKTLIVNIQSSTVPAPDDLMIVRGTSRIPYELPGSRLVVPLSAVYPQPGSPQEPPQEPPQEGKNLELSFTDVLGGTSSVTSLSGLTRRFIALPRELTTSYPVRFGLRGDLIDGVLLRDGSDDIAPDHIDGATVGANHGYSLGECTAVGHGKTAADCGSIWELNGVSYVLVDVVSADTLLIANQLTNSAVPTGEFTHVSGAGSTAAITVTSVTSRQWYPPHKNWSLRALADNIEISPGEDTIKADNVKFVEQADMLSRSDIINSWIDNGGMPGGYEPNAPASIAQTITYEYDKRGQITIARDWLTLKDIPVADYMGLQFGRVGTEQTYIVPGSLPFSYQGETVDYSMGMPADHTLASGSSVTFVPSRLQETGEFAHRVLVLYQNVVFAIGLLPVGDAAFDVRRDRVSASALEIRGNSGKLYFRVLDIDDHISVVGDQYSAIGYRHILPRSLDRTAFYAVEGGGATWVFADWHNKEGLDRLPIDEQYPELIGRSFEVIEARNVTVKAGVLAGSLPVIVNAAASSATLIFRVQ